MSLNEDDGMLRVEMLGLEMEQAVAAVRNARTPMERLYAVSLAEQAMDGYDALIDDIVHEEFEEDVFPRL